MERSAALAGVDVDAAQVLLGHIEPRDREARVHNEIVAEVYFADQRDGYAADDATHLRVHPVLA